MSKRKTLRERACEWASRARDTKYAKPASLDRWSFDDDDIILGVPKYVRITSPGGA